MHFQGALDYFWPLPYGQPLSLTFSTTEKQPSELLVCVRLPSLSEGLYSRSLLNFIGGVIGSVAKIDRTTDNKTRG